MPVLPHNGKLMARCCAILWLWAATAAYAAMNPAFELDPALLQHSGAAPNASPGTGKRAAKVRAARQKGAPGSAPRVHTVQAGDNLFKILMRDYGLTNAEAEACIAETLRANNISNIKRLKIGQKIIFPRLPGSRQEPPKNVSRVSADRSGDDPPPVSSQALRLASPRDTGTDPEALHQVKAVWNKLVPRSDTGQKPFSFQTSTFSLALDPDRFPIFTALDGSRIVVDQHDSIPPLVKSLMAEKDPTVRIVSGSPISGRRFLAELLGAAGFYSVENDFILEFGLDPTLKVHADFKIEKTAESLIRQDVVLLNSSKQALPRTLTAFLKGEGFTAHEPFAEPPFSPVRTARGQIRQITAASQPEMVDAVLNAMAVTAITDRRVDVFAADNNGISLSVKAERYFERDGKRFVIAGFGGDPVTYTLFRILETKGHRVVILDAKDDFRTISEKILTALQVTGNYARHVMVPDSGSNYSLRMSGFRLEGAGVPGGSLFLTNRPLDRIIRELLAENGYDVQVK